MSLIETIRAAIDRHRLIPDNTHVVVGVSGGADSVALLRALHALHIPLTVAHLNHRLRGEAADGDEHFVRELAEELNLPCVVKSVDVHQLAQAGGLSIEMAARQARHDFFAEFENAVIALAHHADDQVETFLLKLARGAGPDGLSGMPYAQSIGPLRLIRPLIAIPRSELIAWLEKHHFEWCEDASNSDETFLRNRVRHTILPLLEQELNPNMRGSILRTMDILRAENEYLNAATPSPTELGASVLQQPLALQRRMVRQWLFDHEADTSSFDAVDKILELMEAGEGTTIFELNAKQRVVVEYGTPRFESSNQGEATTQVVLTTEHGTGWRKDHGLGIGILPAEASFNADKVGDSPITVRTVHPGDRMRPLGMAGHRKLQDIFTDLKIPKMQRSTLPVVVCRDEIIWIPGYRTACGWEVEGFSGKAVHVRIEHK